jgi:predicted extracellular nuclease
MNRVAFRLARAVLAAALTLAALRGSAASPNVVISQIYGGGGNTGAPYTNDFIELFNRGSSAVSLSGWSLQYTSATGTGNFGSATNLITPLSGTIQPGQYFLVAEAGGATGVALPAADVTDATPINMSATGGKVALVNTTTPLGCNGGSTACTPAALATIVDLVGWDGANFFEGASAAPATTNTTAVFRASGGCTDTDGNGSDFSAAAPSPRNSASALHFCNSTSPSGSGAATPSSGPVGASTVLTVTVTPGTGPASTGLTVTGNLSAIGGAASQAFYDDGLTAGDAVANDNVFTYTATVAAGTTAGAKSLPFSIADAQSRTGGGSITFSVDPPLLAIHAIQGSTSTSPYAGQLVATTGIVTGIKTLGGRGFYLEAPDTEWDADPATSEGIFVFTSVAPAVSLGDAVKVTGTVQEFRSASDTIALRMTEIASPTVTLLSSGNVLPTAITLTSLDFDPSGAPDQLERYEGMRVHADSLVVVAPTQGTISEANATSTSTGIFYGVLPGTPRPFRGPGIDATQDPLPASPCCYPIFDTNPEKIRVDSKNQPGAAAIDVATGAVVSSLTGPLDYGQDTYSILLDAASGATVDHSSEMTIVSAPAPYGAEFTVASANLERFFDTVDDPEQDVALTPAAFATRLQKASLLIRNVLGTPDILGVEEMEHLSTLQALADQVNADAVANGDPDPMYVPYLEEGNDIGGIDSGFLVKSARVEVVDVVQYNKDETYIDPTTSLPALLNDRPPLVLRAKVHHASGLTYPVTVVVNHLRSFSSVSDPTDGPRVRAKRAAQAESLAKLIQSFQTADPTAAIASIGDYNAYQFSDGYVDSLAAVEGHPAAAPDVVVPTGDFVDPDLVNLVDGEPAADRYSYTFSGNAQEIDHVVVNGVLYGRFSRMGHPRVNADFPEVNRNDGSSPSRISDHDPVIAYFEFPLVDIAPDPANPHAVKVATAGGASGSFTLRATLTDPAPFPKCSICDALPVTVTLTPVGAGSPISVEAIAESCDGTSLVVAATFTGVPVNVYDVTFTVSTACYQGSAESVLAVYDPSLGFVSGGGVLVNPNTGRLANFGFNVKYNKKGGTQGSLLYAEYDPAGEVRVKSNSIQSLSIVGSEAIILTKNATVTPEPGADAAGGYSVRVRAVDNGEPGTSDELGLQVIDPTGAVVLDLTFDPQTIGGGNIQVPHSGK